MKCIQYVQNIIYMCVLIPYAVDRKNKYFWNISAKQKPTPCYLEIRSPLSQVQWPPHYKYNLLLNGHIYYNSIFTPSTPLQLSLTETDPSHHKRELHYKRHWAPGLKLSRSWWLAANVNTYNHTNTDTQKDRIQMLLIVNFLQMKHFGMWYLPEFF